MKKRHQDDDGSSAEDGEVLIVNLQPMAARKDSSSSDEEDGVEMSIEKAFQKAGQFGWFQIRLLLFQLVYHIPAAYHILAITFAGLTPKWTCLEDDYYSPNNTNSTDGDCHLYNDPQINCTPIYTSRFYSIAQEWELLCDRSYIINLTQSGLFLGFLVGSFVLGSLSDKFGRRIITIGFLVGLAVVETLIALSPNYYLFALGRFFVGFLIPGGITSYVLVCELAGPSHRSLIAVSQAVVFGLGFGFIALCAYLLPNWRWFTAASAFISVILIFYYRYIPESPRWLLVNGKEEEAKRTLVEIATVNGRSLPSGFSLEIPPRPRKESRFMFLGLFKNRVLSIRMLLMMLEWFTVCMVYYALTLGVGNLSSNIYLAFTLSGLIEIPANFLTLLMLEKIGRKWTNVGLLFIGGVASLSCAFIQFTKYDTSGYIQLTLSLLGKFAVAGSFSVIYTYTPELVPTNLRNSGIGIVNVCARLGGILAPLIILLDSHVALGLSMLIMGVLGTVTCFLCLYLPETLGMPLPDTAAEIKMKKIKK